MSKRWYVEIDVNGGEYGVELTIYAEHVERVDEDTIIADGIRIESTGTIESVEVEDAPPTVDPHPTSSGCASVPDDV